MWILQIHAGAPALRLRRGRLRRLVSILQLDRDKCSPPRRKNAKALWLSLEESKRLAKEKAAAAAKASRLNKERAHVARGLAELPSSYEFSGTSNDVDDPPSVDAYCEDFNAYYQRPGDAGKCQARKW